jgi:hypothetical protein
MEFPVSHPALPEAKRCGEFEAIHIAAALFEKPFEKWLLL